MSSLPVYFGSLTGIITLLSYWPYILAAGIVITLLLGLAFFLLIKKKSPVSKPSKQAAISDSTDPILSSFMKLNGSCRTILLAGTCIDVLPVTIPVNLAIQLAKNGKCLLIDLDSKRDSSASVFEINSLKMNRDLKVCPVSSLIENLDIWPAQYFNLLKQMNLRLLLDDANRKYDYIILYAPYLPSLPDRKQIAFFSKQAIVFSKKDTDRPRLHELLNTCKCRILHEA